MKKIFLILVSIIFLTSFTLHSIYIEPTGTYQLVDTTKNEDGLTYGYLGYIQVKKIAINKIVMTFEDVKAPNYNSGSFVDTLDYKNNIAVYTTPHDSTCAITFEFDEDGVTVKEKAADYNSGCAFGQGIDASGYYEITSKKTPILIQPLTGDTL